MTELQKKVMHEKFREVRDGDDVYAGIDQIVEAVLAVPAEIKFIWDKDDACFVNGRYIGQTWHIKSQSWRADIPQTNDRTEYKTESDARFVVEQNFREWLNGIGRSK